MNFTALMHVPHVCLFLKGSLVLNGYSAHSIKIIYNSFKSEMSPHHNLEILQPRWPLVGETTNYYDRISLSMFCARFSLKTVPRSPLGSRHILTVSLRGPYSSRVDWHWWTTCTGQSANLFLSISSCYSVQGISNISDQNSLTHK